MFLSCQAVEDSAVVTMCDKSLGRQTTSMSIEKWLPHPGRFQIQYYL